MENCQRLSHSWLSEKAWAKKCTASVNISRFWQCPSSFISLSQVHGAIYTGADSQGGKFYFPCTCSSKEAHASPARAGLQSTVYFLTEIPCREFDLSQDTHRQGHFLWTHVPLAFQHRAIDTYQIN